MLDKQQLASQRRSLAIPTELFILSIHCVSSRM